MRTNLRSCTVNTSTGLPFRPSFLLLHRPQKRNSQIKMSHEISRGNASDIRQRNQSIAGVRRSDGSVAAIAVLSSNRVHCHHCDKPFANEEKRDEHIRQYSRDCLRCDETWIYCKIGLSRYTDHPYCSNTCAEYGECFPSASDAHQHARKASHERYFWKGCTSAKAYGDWSDYLFMEHIRRMHGYDA